MALVGIKQALNSDRIKCHQLRSESNPWPARVGGELSAEKALNSNHVKCHCGVSCDRNLSGGESYVTHYFQVSK